MSLVRKFTSLQQFKMSVQESKDIGGKQLLKAAAFVFALYEISMLYKHTSGDFANGILFFIQGQVNVYFIMFIALYFLTMFLAGRQAGYSVLIKKKKYYGVVFLNAFITTAVTLGLFELAINFILYNEPQVLETKEIVHLLITSFIIIFVILIVAWFWAVSKIQRLGAKAL